MAITSNVFFSLKSRPRAGPATKSIRLLPWGGWRVINSTLTSALVSAWSSMRSRVRSRHRSRLHPIALVVDAKTPTVEEFYQRYGFQRLETDRVHERRFYLLMDTIRQLFSRAP